MRAWTVPGWIGKNSVILAMAVLCQFILTPLFQHATAALSESALWDKSPSKTHQIAAVERASLMPIEGKRSKSISKGFEPPKCSVHATLAHCAECQPSEYNKRHVAQPFLQPHRGYWLLYRALLL